MSNGPARRLGNIFCFSRESAYGRNQILKINGLLSTFCFISVFLCLLFFCFYRFGCFRVFLFDMFAFCTRIDLLMVDSKCKASSRRESRWWPDKSLGWVLSSTQLSNITRWWFHVVSNIFYFHPYLGKWFPFWLLVFKWVGSTTN